MAGVSHQSPLSREMVFKNQQEVNDYVQTYKYSSSAHKQSLDVSIMI